MIRRGHRPLRAEEGQEMFILGDGSTLHWGMMERISSPLPFNPGIKINLVKQIFITPDVVESL
jgi:hypothetical protein